MLRLFTSMIQTFWVWITAAAQVSSSMIKTFEFGSPRCSSFFFNDTFWVWITAVAEVSSSMMRTFWVWIITVAQVSLPMIHTFWVWITLVAQCFYLNEVLLLSLDHRDIFFNLETISLVYTPLKNPAMQLRLCRLAVTIRHFRSLSNEVGSCSVGF